MRIFLLAFFVLTACDTIAQRLENIRAEAINGGESVIITYDLTGGSSSSKYKVAIYSSHNNFATPLTQVTGDLNDVTPGNGKRIVWNTRNEISEYSGDITFELRADPILAPLSVKTPGGVKKGKSTTVAWEGTTGESVRLELVKNGVVVNQIGTTNDLSKYIWNVPPDLEKGSGYQIRLTANGRSVNSDAFSVKNKVKPIYYIIPGAVVVGAAVFLATQGGGAGSKDLPTPPDVSTYQ